MPKTKTRRGSRPIDLSEIKFGRLIVLEDVGRKRGNVVWKCECDCGNVVDVLSVDLIREHTQSCGCFHSDQVRTIAVPKIRKSYGEASFNKVFRSYKRSAKRRDLLFQMEKSDFRVLTQKDCFYCGSPPMQVSCNGATYNGEYIYNGIDRIDNSIGYIKENCVPCCWKCNSSKGSLSLDEFMNLITKVYNNLAKNYLQSSGAKCQK